MIFHFNAEATEDNPCEGVIDIEDPGAFVETFPDEVDIGWLMRASDADFDMDEVDDWEPDETLMGVIPTTLDDPEAILVYKDGVSPFAYKPDPDAEFTAWVSYENGTTVRVIASKWVCNGTPTSPCYPDAATPYADGQLVMLCLPPEGMKDTSATPRVRKGVPASYWTKHYPYLCVETKWVQETGRILMMLTPKALEILIAVFPGASFYVGITLQDDHPVCPRDPVYVLGWQPHQISLTDAFCIFSQKEN